MRALDYGVEVTIQYPTGRKIEATVDGIDRSWPAVALPASGRKVYLLSADGSVLVTTVHADGMFGDVAESVAKWVQS